jgi:predicted methyltransferase
LRCQAAVRRVALLYRSGALEGRRIALLGDDDPVALPSACSPPAATELPKRLWCSKSTHSALNSRAGRARCRSAVDVILHDLREPFPPQFLGSLTVLKTDLPYRRRLHAVRAPRR